MTNPLRPKLLAWIIGVVVLLTGCSSDTSERDLLVLGPASLGDHLDAFNEPWKSNGADFSFAGSTTQVRAVLEGVDADVLITANPEVAAPIVDELGFEAVALVTNSLAVIAPTGNPAGIESLAELSRDDLLIAVCAAEVPCGTATQRLPVVIAADTAEPSVRAVLTKVEEGSVDVGVVYATDAAIGRVEQPISLTGNEVVSTTYVVFALTAREVTTDYIDALLADGRDHLIELDIGFGAP